MSQRFYKERRAALMGTAALGAVIALTTTAAAQDTLPDETEESDVDVIVVQGFRRSIASSIETKRTSDIVAEVVTAEDIGRLPDISIADALGRLPGVTTQRTGGQASALNIRGLSQDLVSADFNGREQVSTSGLRTIEFEQYPSELIYQAQVYKSPKASQIEGGVAGRIELRTIRPLDFNERNITLNLRGSYNDRADDSPDANDFGYRFSASYYDQFADGRVGVALGYARLEQANVNTRSVGFDFQQGNNFGDTATIDGVDLPLTNAGAPVLDLNGDGQADAVPFGFESVISGGDEVRDAILGVFQFEPSDRVRIMVDAYYSQFESENFRRGVRLFGTSNIQNQGFIDNGDGTATGIAPNADLFIDPQLAGNAVIGGTFLPGSGAGVENVNQDDGDNDEIFNVGLNAEVDLTDRLTIAGDIAYSRADTVFNNAGITTQPGTLDADGNFTPAAIRATFLRRGLDPIDQDFGGFDFSDPATNQLGGFFIVPNEDEDELFSFRADAEYDVSAGPISSVEVGLRYTDRESTNTVFSFSGSGDGFGSFGFNGPTPIPAGLVETGGFSGDFALGGAPNFAVLDIGGIFDTLIGPTPADQEFGFTRDQSFTITEETIAGYAQVNLDSALGGVPYRGNIGLRIVETEQMSVTQSNDEAGISPVGDTFTEILPSLNLAFNVTPNDIIRISGSRQISRPRFQELGAGVSISADETGFLQGGGGNPALRPFLANQGEILYEHYFENTGIFTAGFFYKDLESFIIGGVDPNFDFGATGFAFPPLPGNAPEGTVIDPVGTLSGPINGQGGEVYGLEFQYTQAFDFLPAPWDGLGVVLNYGYTESSIDLPESTLSGNAVAIPLPGLSRHVTNPTFFYSKDGFDTRVSFNYRSGFVANQFGLNEQITGFDDELYMDFQTSYEFDTGTLDGVELLFQIQNLLDTRNSSFFGVEAQTGTVQQFGRRIFAGASYQF